MASVSRSHLYRASGPARPVASVVLAALWCGGAIAVLAAAWPLFMSGMPLTGQGAAVVERAFVVLTGGGLLVALGVLAAELFGGRTQARWARLVGAIILLLVSGIGTVQSFRHVVRPGTPVPMDAPEISMQASTSTAHGQERFLLTLVGLAGSSLILGAGLLALRSGARAQ